MKLTSVLILNILMLFIAEKGSNNLSFVICRIGMTTNTNQYQVTNNEVRVISC